MGHDRDKKPHTIDLPYLHPVVDLKDLNENGKLLTDEQIQLVDERIRILMGDDIDAVKEVYSKISKHFDEDEHQFTIQRLDALEDNQGNGRYSKKFFKDLGVNFGIIKNDDQLHAVYKGVKHGKELGVGSWGKVKITQDLQDAHLGALKVQEGNEEVFAVEHKVTETLERTKTPIITRSQKGEDKPDKGQFIQNILPGTSLAKAVAKKQLSPMRKLSVALNVGSSLDKLHKAGWLHRDFYQNNVMCDLSRRTTDVIDFGLSTEIGHQMYTPLNHPADWFPPEYNDPLKQNEKIDIYAYGYLLKWLLGFEYEVSTWKENKTTEIWEKKGINRYQVQTEFSRNDKLQKLLNAMMDKDPDKRPSIDTITTQLREVYAEVKAQHPIKIGILNAEEYLKYPKDDDTWLRELRKNFDEVTLVASDQITPEELIQIRRDLEDWNIVVRDKVLINPDLAYYHQYFSEAEKSEDVILHAKVVSIVNKEMEVSEIYLGTEEAVALVENDAKLLQVCLQQLMRDLLTYQDKHPSKQVTNMVDTLADLIDRYNLALKNYQRDPNAHYKTFEKETLAIFEDFSAMKEKMIEELKKATAAGASGMFNRVSANAELIRILSTDQDALVRHYHQVENQAELISHSLESVQTPPEHTVKLR